MVKQAPTRRQYLGAGEGPLAELAEQFRSLEIDFLAWGPQGIQDDLKREFMRATNEGRHKGSKASFEEGSTRNMGTDFVGGDIPRVIVQDYS
jgi:hypothetical protein